MRKDEADFLLFTAFGVVTDGGKRQERFLCLSELSHMRPRHQKVRRLLRAWQHWDQRAFAFFYLWRNNRCGCGQQEWPAKNYRRLQSLAQAHSGIPLEAFVFFLKYSRVFPLFVGLAIVTVFGHLVDEKERENLHALGKKGLFFFQMGLIAP